ncbi:ABC transporter permease [Gardnerella vaginalis]|jgi:ABC superfamily ATP binding cassette transporter, membrane protein|uniref:ABC transporter, permease protein n=1 Tax=Gardnerella vaginalis (strain ATCC 14019 / 317) TaxID=525284 RepID=E3D7L1_GARV3|nr:ABC transporter permease subunit [Gardnerella vaginalis]ADP39303.1 ABC transporter, permease protein [Gardnerella vaginalis ATCC 14019]EPI50073.1 ABC transporter, permease protein [Gardnerella vaginalis JCP7672]EPI54424.1 ABC transporter, permease protein [Gardnerella vaginalis JCP7276]KOS09523.1 sulfonate ABC transporter permease [Gardnerella vaginalis]PKY97085.1 sulfonate ABC transporter permease [Gardnerella vaginalis]
MTIFTTSGKNGASTQVDENTRFWSDIIVCVGIIALFGVSAFLLQRINQPIGPKGIPSAVSTDLINLPYYTLRSVFRMMLALIASLIFTIIYGSLAARSRRLGKVLIPLLDILQSVPILGFLSATVTIWLVIFPGSMMGVEAASIFAIFTSQAWNMTFSFHRSLLSEPKELDEAVRSLQLTHWQRFWVLDMPNAMIPLLWNCMMSVGGGWFFLTASEMISVNNHTYALPGVGSFVAQSAAENKLGNIWWAILSMIVVVLAIDFFLWKPLTAWAERFRITQSASDEERKSAVLTLIRHSHADEVISKLFSPIREWLEIITRPFGRTGSQWPRKASQRKLGDLVFNIVMAVLILGLAAQMLYFVATRTGLQEFATAGALGALTFARVAVLIFVSSLIWVPVGVYIGMNPKISRIMQPVVQILASFPANFVFPFAMMWFMAWHIDLGWGSIILMALGTQWYILFNVIAGASAIPDDLREMARSFRLNRMLKWKTLVLPAIFGSWCTGGITAAGGAWNASIVSEIVEYGKNHMATQGLGAYITNATTVGDSVKTLVGVTVMSLIVVLSNRLFWTPLQRYSAKRFVLN